MEINKITKLENMENYKERRLRTYLGLLMALVVWCMLIGCTTENVDYDCKCYTETYIYYEVLDQVGISDVSDIYDSTCNADKPNGQLTYVYVGNDGGYTKEICTD